MEKIAASSTSLIDIFPATRGPVIANAPLNKMTWFRTGGCAQFLFTPEDADDLAEFLAKRPKDLPITVIGLGSNLLVRDGGVPGVVIRLGKGFADIRLEKDGILAGAGALDRNVAELARDAGIAGFEFLMGVPGVIGGALRMNAGAYGREMKEITQTVVALDDTGELRLLTAEDMGFSYRHSSPPRDWIFLNAFFTGYPDNREAIDARMAEIRKNREESQPLGTRTGGSTFANPPNQKAWQLIDKAGCRGLTIGDAMVSEKHCNFLINKGKASSDDIEALGEEVIRRVMDNSGVTLEWEIRRIGVAKREASW